MSFPSEERIREIKLDAERLRKFKKSSIELAAELIDFVIKIQLENLRKKYPTATEQELFSILRKQIMKSDENWKKLSKTFLNEQ